MGLQDTGVRLRAENEKGFLSAMDRAKGSVDSFVKTAGGATAGLNPLSLATVALGSAIGGLAVNIATKAVTAIGDLGRSAIDAAADMQTLQLSLETLAAREMVASGGAADMNEALAKIGPIADGLLKRIRDLSIQSPFEYQDVVRVFQLNMAFGQTSETALELTRAITNMAAAMGGNGAIIERIAYNFSQMNLVGKVTMRDIRDLAMAGVDLARVLREELGMSIEEVNKALESGKITMQDVSEAFVSYADKNFGSAAERMSRTFKGLISSFKDLFFFSSIDLLGPSLEVISKALGGILDRAMALVDSGALQKIGVVLGILTEKVLAGVGLLGDAMSKISDMIISPLRDTADSALGWGTNIIQQLAIGIINGASAALTWAMDFIANMLANFLSPGSPPKVAPNIDKWGMAAMTQWLKGFTEADFSVLKAIQSPIRDVFSMMVSIGEMSSKKAGELFASISKDIAKAITDGGKVSEELFERIKKAGGSWGTEIADLARKQIAYGVAVEEAKKAEEALEEARKRQSKAQAQVAKGLREYNDMLRKGASKAELEAKRLAINESAKEAAIQKGKAEAAEKDLENAKERVDLLAQQVKLQEELVRQLLEISRMQILPPEDEGGDGGGGGGGDKPPVPPGFGSGIRDAVENLKQQLAEMLAHLFDPILDAWNRMVATLRGKLEELIAAFWAWVGRFQPIWDKLAFIAEWAWDKITKIVKWAWGEILATAEWFEGEIKAWWKRHGDNVIFVARSIWNTVTTTVATILNGLLTQVIVWIGQIETWWRKHGSTVESIWRTFTEGVKQIFSLALENIGNFFDTWAAIFKGDWDTVLKELKDSWANTWQAIQVINATMTVVIGKIIQLFLDWILTTLEEKVKLWLKAITNAIPNFRAAGEDLLLGLGKGIREGATAVVTTVAGEMVRLIDKAKSVLGIKSPSSIFRGIGENMMQGLIDGVLTKAGAVADAIIQAVKEGIAAALKALGIGSPSKVFMDIGKQSMRGLEIGAEKESKNTSAGIMQSISAVIQPARTAAQYQTVTNAPQINLGGNTINTGMDQAIFEARVRAIIASEL